MTKPPESSHDDHDVVMITCYPSGLISSDVDFWNRWNSNKLKLPSIIEANEDEEEGSDRVPTNGEDDDAVTVDRY